MPAFLVALFGSPISWVGLLCACLLGMTGVQTLRLNHAKSDLATEQHAVVVMGQAIGEQNQAIDAWKTQAQEATEAGQEAVQAAEAKRPAVVVRVKRIAAVAPPPAGVCRDAAIVDLVHESLK